MMTFQTMNTKRRREDDSDDDDDFDDRHLKKSRPWDPQASKRWADNDFFSAPCSSAPSPPHIVPALEVMTPAESECSDENSPASLPEDYQIVLSTHETMGFDMHMDEDEPDAITSPPLDPPFVTNFRPPKLNFDLFSRDQARHAPDLTHRIPTPIYPTFYNTGSMGGVGHPNSGMAGALLVGNGFLGAPSATANAQSISHGRQRSQDRSVRMPSPISEDEDLPDTPTALTQSQLSRLSVTSNYSSDRMDTEMGPPAITPTRGRKRSGALTGIGRFSMGFREDCEKCRLRVPGHYSHFI